MTHKILIAACLSLFAFSAFAQKHWVVFTNKDTANYDYRKHLSPAAIEKRQLMGIPLVQATDIPLTQAYLQAMGQQQIHSLAHSKWLNAVSANLNEAQKQWLLRQPFVKEIIAIDGNWQTQQVLAPDWTEYAEALAQMEAGAFQAAKLNGAGIIVGIIDAGFYNAHKQSNLAHIFANNRILGVRDLVNPSKEDHFGKIETFSDWHGTRVMECVAGKNEGKGEQFGLATEASFYLARTDHGSKEFRGEEDYWINAMEWMDSLGVRIINTSLGYALGFDNPDECYRPEQMDGRTSMITKAAQIAVDDKGLLLIVSAGNEGGNPEWRIVSAPADAQGVVSVGATNKNGFKAGYSSEGPISLRYLKPNVACYSSDGTSFSAPAVTGFAACLMQLNPKANNKQLMEVLQQSGSLYPYGNNYLGYGIPSAPKAINLMNGKLKDPSFIEEKQAKGKASISFKVKGENIALANIFHKAGEREVIREMQIKPSKGKIQVKRLKKATRTTVVFDNGRGHEIIWE